MTNLYELFAPHSLHQLQRRIADGYSPTGRDLAEYLRANADQILSPWFVDLLAHELIERSRKPMGRPRKRSPVFETIDRRLLKIRYDRLLSVLQRRKKRKISNRHPFKSQDWWDDTPHVCAAKVLAAHINKSRGDNIDSRTISNMISSH